MRKKIILFLFLGFNLLASESDVYNFKWLDQDKKIFVLQNREFRKKDRFHAALSLGLTTSGEFIDSLAFQGRAGYFFKENWGLEMIYSANTPKENDSAKAVIAQGTVPFYRGVTSYFGGGIKWAPFYSKINTFNKIVYSDIILGLGLVAVADEDNRARFTGFSNTKLTAETHIGLTWNIGAVFYMTRNWGLRVDFNAIHYQAKQYKASGINSMTSSSELHSHYDFTLGLQYSF